MTVINELVRIHHQEYLEDLDFWISRLAGCDPVLELGCGHGRVTLPLVQAGREVIGLDLDPESLRYARNAAGVRGLPGPDLIQADMLALPLRGAFGAVILPCNTYSTFQRGERARLLAGIRRLLRPGGLFLASLPNPILLRDLHQELSQEDSGVPEDPEAFFSHPLTGNPVQVSSRLGAGSNCLTWEWIYDHLLPDGSTERLTQSVSHQLSSPEQYQEELTGAGFGPTGFLGDFDGSPYLPDAPFLIIAAESS